MENVIKEYPIYKDSGVEWLGEIPSHWSEIKIKINSKIYNGDSLNENKKAKYESDDETHLAYISSKDIDLDTSIISYENGLRIPRNEPKYKVAKSNSSLICIEGGSAGRKIAYTNQDVCFVNKLACVSAKNNISSKYLYYTLKGSLFQTQFKLAMSGMIGGVAISSINNFYILVPPLPEQSTIASFLDRKTVLIEQAIDIKQKQIELLKERRQILIHKAVTRGLNPKAKMKDSGVEWIGEIPEGWTVTSVKHVLEMPICDGPHTTPLLYEEGYPFVSAEAIKNGEVDFDKIRGFISLKDYLQFSKKYSPKRNDIYMVKSGATTGNVAMVRTDIEFSIWSPLAVFRANQKKVIPNYLLNYLESPSFRLGVELSWSFGTQQNIGMGILSNLPIAYPSLDDQILISEYISRVTDKVKSAISLKEQEIEKLKEYKATLINSAVTGKIKVG